MVNREAERKRLVELIGSKVCDDYSPNCDEYSPHTCEKCYANSCRIGELADHLLDNGVVVPPVKVGDKIYYLIGKKVFNLTVEKIVIQESGMFLVDKSFNDWYSIEELGKTLYLSEEAAEAAEAEKALKGDGDSGKNH